MEEDRETTYITVEEISTATETHIRTIFRRANKENWEFLLSKRNRKLFVFENLPQDIQEALTSYWGKKDDAQIADNPSDKSAEPNNSIKLTPQIEKQELNTRQKDITNVLRKLQKSSVIILGKVGIGKSYLLRELSKELPKERPVILFTEPPTAKTILLNIAIAINSQLGANKEETLTNFENYQGSPVFLCIDQLEHMTPSAIEVLDRLFKFNWFRFIGAGHLGGKRRYNTTWMKAKGYFLRPIGRHEALSLINSIWTDRSKTIKRTIIDEAKGIPGEIVRMASEAKQGIMPKPEQKYLDATPFILIIATIGLAVRVIGYGYQSTETYIMGGVIAAVFWGLFWIYRGYVAGWWGTKKQFKGRS